MNVQTGTWCEDDIYWSIADVDKNPVLRNQYISLDSIAAECLLCFGLQVQGSV